MLASVEAVYRKAHSTLRGSLRKRRTIRLAKGYFAARGSLGDFDRMEAFLLVRRGSCFSPKSLFYSHQVWKNNGVAPFKSLLGAK